jgi:hypothetical protein
VALAQDVDRRAFAAPKRLPPLRRDGPGHDESNWIAAGVWHRASLLDRQAHFTAENLPEIRRPSVSILNGLQSTNFI